MPRAAPGDSARGVLRRDLPDHSQVTVRYFDSCRERCQYCPEMDIRLHRSGNRSQKLRNFTLQLSGFGVERVGLGEVVSMVGDCRPPPPGNPRLPTIPMCIIVEVGEWRVRLARTVMGGFCFIPEYPKSGEVLLRCSVHRSFNKHHPSYILKELNIPQYFKNNRSYTSCVEREPVLKFGHSHSHLCGQMGVEPPSIAITNVLETR